MPATWTDLKDKVRKYYKFSKEEVRDIVISIVVLAFIIGFDDGSATFNITHWLLNYFNVFLIVGLALLVHLSAQRLQALHIGYRAEYKLWWYGLLFGLGMIFLTRGNVWFLLPGGIFLHHLATHRLGFFRYGLNMMQNDVICLMGPLSNILLAIIFKIFLVGMPTNPLLLKAVSINVWLALFTMLPIPPLDGSRVLFHSRMIYAFMFGCFIGATILLLTVSSLFWSIFGSLLIGFVIWILYYLLYERKA